MYNCVTVTVALAESRGAGQVLREGAAGTPTAHATVPGLERARQLRLRHQEEEAKERAHHHRLGRYTRHLTHTLNLGGGGVQFPVPRR